MRRLAPLLVVLAGCHSSRSSTPSGYDASVPTDTCGSVRLTEYTASAVGWCEWDRTASFLPQFVRDGITAAIAEPFNGGSYGGASGEACGECWEVDTIGGTAVVMIHDLCPVAGNPPCDGSFFHFDLASETGAALMATGIEEGSARRVPCPVSGNVHAQVNDQNDYYLRIAFLNHRIPIRSAEVRGAGPGVAADNPYVPLVRSGGAFDVSGPGRPLANGGDGLVVRLTSAQGEVIEATLAIPATGAKGTFVDLGVQLTDQHPVAGTTCAFVPPGDIYVDGWGGIPSVTWKIDPWGAAASGSYGETTSLCASGSCVRVSNLAQWSGFHLYYPHAFPTSTFTTLTLRARTVSGSGTILVSPSLAGATCTGTMVDVGTSYTDVAIPIASVCAGVASLDAVTIQCVGSDIGLVIDDVRLLP